MIRPAIKAAAPLPPEDKPETVDEVVDDAELLPGADGMPRLEAPIDSTKLERARAKWLKDWDAGFSDPQHVGVALSESGHGNCQALVWFMHRIDSPARER